MKNKKRGFTLIELLAVLVILVIIMAIATPIILGIIDESKISANKSTVSMIADSAETLIGTESLDSESEIYGKIQKEENIFAYIHLTNKPDNGIVTVKDSKISVAVYLDGACYTKGYDSTEVLIDDKVSKEDCAPLTIYSDSILKGLDPQISPGLVPVTINQDGTVISADIKEKWYDYENKQWANAVVVTEGTDTTVGSIIEMQNIQQMFVWIPRYNYDETTIVNAQTAIEIEFVQQNENAHPAFTFGTEEQKGLWIGKFEISAENKIIPNVDSVTNLSMAEFYYKIREINNTNGLDSSSDVHMIKNTEWGLVAYFSQSKYGVCNSDGTCTNRIENNSYYLNNFVLTTGCYGGEISIKASCPNSNKWNTELGILASTNNNITGIYDMAGGRWEYTMSLIKNSSGSINNNLTGFITFPEEKYYDLYEYNIDRLNVEKSLKGDAIRELNGSNYTASIPSGSFNTYGNWNNDFAQFIEPSTVTILRGGLNSDNFMQGIFSFGSAYGERNALNSARAVLANS